MADVVKNQGMTRSRRKGAISTRLWGVVIYGGVLAWCLLQLPTAATFVVPAVAAGLILHVVRAKPILAALAFIVIVVVAPALFWPSMLTDAMDGVSSFF